MIEFKELRPGNFILLDTGIVLPEWHKIMPKDIYDISEGRITLNALSGIRLSPEVLIRCEFIDQAGNKMGYRISVNSMDELCWYKQDDALKYQTKGSGFTRDYNIKFLHQLQNLFYILTQTELIINL